MREIRTVAQEAAEDIYFGQLVMIWARWFLIAAGVILALWNVDDSGEAVRAIVPVVALVGLNFYLHGRYLAQRPANPLLITLASLMDIGVITVVVVVWSEQTGLFSPFFILYYPVLLAFAFVMPARSTAVYTVATLAAYVGAVLIVQLVQPDTASLNSDEVKRLVVRLVTLASMGGLGAYYWRIQRSRRPAASPPQSGSEAVS
jgi:hypothetical protein